MNYGEITLISFSNYFHIVTKLENLCLGCKVDFVSFDEKLLFFLVLSYYYEKDA